MTDRYFSALELLNPPDWAIVGGFHPHITIHYFGALPEYVVADIKDALKPWKDKVFALTPDLFARFGAGWALTFVPDDELGRVITARRVLGDVPGIDTRIDQTFPDFRAHMSLPNNDLPLLALEQLTFRGPVLLATKSITVHA